MCFLHWGGTVEGTLSCFALWRVILEGTLSCFIYHRGIHVLKNDAHRGTMGGQSPPTVPLLESTSRRPSVQTGCSYRRYELARVYVLRRRALSARTNPQSKSHTEFPGKDERQVLGLDSSSSVAHTLTAVCRGRRNPPFIKFFNLFHQRGARASGPPTDFLLS